MQSNGNGDIHVVMLEEAGFRAVAGDTECLRQVRESFPSCNVVVCMRPSLAGKTLAEIERRAIVDTLRAYHGNKAATARALGVCEKTIYNKVKRLQLG